MDWRFWLIGGFGTPCASSRFSGARAIPGKRRPTRYLRYMSFMVVAQAGVGGWWLGRPRDFRLEVKRYVRIAKQSLLSGRSNQNIESIFWNFCVKVMKAIDPNYGIECGSHNPTRLATLGELEQVMH